MFIVPLDLKVLIVAIIIGILRYNKSNHLYFRLLPLFLLLTLLVELLSQLMHHTKNGNVFIYNLFTILEFTFLSFVFWSIIPNPQAAKQIRQFSFILPAICLCNVFFIQGVNTFHSYTYMLGCLVMIFYSIIYFYQIFNSSQRFDLLREPAFWISIGVMFFYISSFSVFGLLNNISKLPNILKYNLQKILYVVNAFYYTLFIIAFLCQFKITKSRSSLS